jgi:hypothetical protein
MDNVDKVVLDETTGEIKPIIIYADTHKAA